MNFVICLGLKRKVGLKREAKQLVQLMSGSCISVHNL